MLDWWCRAGRGNAVKTRRVEQAVKILCLKICEAAIDLSKPLNSDCDAEIDNETPVKTVGFSNALEAVKTYLIRLDINDTVFSPLYQIDKEFFRVTNQKDIVKHLLVSILKFPINS
ncbi:hypothetical protein TNCV_3362331 [Trichonephila clavipes]|nr:hypothetical protein TNCV_3362331 [Trichonephila clavipes]